MKLKQIVILSGLLLAAAAQAEVRASQAWARFTVPGMTSGGVFMQLENGSPADALIGGSSPVAESVEIHEHVMAGGNMRMQAMPQTRQLPCDADRPQTAPRRRQPFPAHVEIPPRPRANRACGSEKPE